MIYKELSKGCLILEDGTRFNGFIFGYSNVVCSQVVFNTSMAGYPDIITDPSNTGLLVCITYPTIGNYGFPAAQEYVCGTGTSGRKYPVLNNLESSQATVKALIICDYSQEYSHWKAECSMGDWMEAHKVTGICGIDTRYLAQILRDKGTMKAQIVPEGCQELDFNKCSCTLGNVPECLCTENIEYKSPAAAGKKVVLLDCGAGNKLITVLLEKGIDILRVPCSQDFTSYTADGIVIAGGPGKAEDYSAAVENIRKALNGNTPLMGIGLGNNILALAAGASNVCLGNGHRGHNEPVTIAGGKKCWISSQNHCQAVDAASLPAGWEVWFTNMNDGSVEGIRCKDKAFYGCQIAPEAASDTMFIIEDFIKNL